MIAIIRTKKLEDLKKTLKKSNSEVIEWQTKYNDLKTKTDKLLKISNQEASSLCERLDLEIQQNKRFLDEIKKLELEISKKTETNEKLGQAQGGLRSSNKRLMDKNNALLKESKELYHEIKLSKELVESLRFDNEKLQKENQSLIDIVQKLQAKINSLKNPKTLEEYKNNGLSKPQKQSLKKLRKKRG